MKNSRQQLPRIQEEKTIIDSANKGARRGALLGGIAGAGAGSYLVKKNKRIAGVLGALGGLGIGNHVGKAVGVYQGAKDVKTARRALRQMEQMRAEIIELKERYADRYQAREDANGNGNESGLSGQDPVQRYRKLMEKLVSPEMVEVPVANIT